MKYFLVPNFPPDYAAFISKPMDWESVQKRLKKRQYDTIAQVVDDLRLIFSNAEKYNAGYKDTDTDSGRAYEAAKIMSVKLETAISKMLLAVSDRLERERIDHQQAEREVEAIDRAAEEEKKQDMSKDEETSEPNAQQKNQPRSFRTKIPRRQPTDFEVPFFDEEGDGRRERSYVEVNKAQKLMFERHQKEKGERGTLADKMCQVVLSHLIDLDRARKVANAKMKESEAKAGPMDVDKQTPKGEPETRVQHLPAPSHLLKELQSTGRTRVCLKIEPPKSKRGNAGTRKRKRAFAGFD